MDDEPNIYAIRHYEGRPESFRAALVVTSLGLLKNGAAAYPAMLEAIRAARSCIALETYIFRGDATGRLFREELEAAAARGVAVEVLVDAVGSWGLMESFWDDLKRAGGRVRYFRPIRRGFLAFRDHRKLLLVDDRVAMVGGINIGDEYVAEGKSGAPPWRDNAVRIEGVEVALLRRFFARMWVRADRPLRFGSLVAAKAWRDRTVGIPGGGRIRFLHSGPEEPIRRIRRAYGRLIGSAEKRIDLAMSYFFPPGRILRALRRAVRRGVAVRLLVPAGTDVAVTRWALRGLYGTLLRAGIRIWEYQPTMLHAKLALIDDVVVIGSANMDLRSTWANYELVAAVTDPELAAEAAIDFEDDLRRSVEVAYEEWRSRPFSEKVKEKISYWFLARADMFFARSTLVRNRW